MRYVGVSGRGGVGGKGDRKGQKIGMRAKSKTQILTGSGRLAQSCSFGRQT